MTKLKTITPDWPAPPIVKAYTTTRLGGTSLPPFDSLNIGYSSGDNKSSVEQNRHLVYQSLQLPSEPVWRKQIHSNIACAADSAIQEADALYSNQPNQVCAIQTADCLPILLCNQVGTEVAAIHAGWRGLADNIIANTLALFSSPKQHLLAWLGPAISQEHFEVGTDVRDSFLKQNSKNTQAFIPHPKQANKYFADLYQLARLQLRALGITAIYGANYCTYSNKQHFFSYRRDHITGRMASLIWLQKR